MTFIIQFFNLQSTIQAESLLYLWLQLCPNCGRTLQGCSACLIDVVIALATTLWAGHDWESGRVVAPPVLGVWIADNTSTGHGSQDWPSHEDALI